jgi:hypothetical protein
VGEFDPLPQLYNRPSNSLGQRLFTYKKGNRATREVSLGFLSTLCVPRGMDRAPEIAVRKERLGARREHSYGIRTKEMRTSRMQLHDLGRGKLLQSLLRGCR